MACATTFDEARKERDGEPTRAGSAGQFLRHIKRCCVLTRLFLARQHRFSRVPLSSLFVSANIVFFYFSCLHG